MGDFFVVSVVVKADVNFLDKWFQDCLTFFAISGVKFYYFLILSLKYKSLESALSTVHDFGFAPAAEVYYSFR
jgi:hypothetical protein